MHRRAHQARLSRRTRFVAITAAALGLIATACGGDDDAADSTVAGTAGGASATPPSGAGATAPGVSGETTGSADSAPAGGEDRQDYIDAGVEELDFPDDEVASCFTETIIDGIGFERIQASGLSPREFFDASSLADEGLGIDEAVQADVAADLAACGDLVGMFGSGENVSEEEAACARELLTDDALAELFVSQIAGVPPSSELAQIGAEITACSEE